MLIVTNGFFEKLLLLFKFDFYASSPNVNVGWAEALGSNSDYLSLYCTARV